MLMVLAVMVAAGVVGTTLALSVLTTGFALMKVRCALRGTIVIRLPCAVCRGALRMHACTAPDQGHHDVWPAALLQAGRW